VQTQRAEGSKVIAIDILLEPDEALIDHARAVNAELRRNFPQGYSLDAAHTPHVTLVQRFVRAGDLDAVEGAVAEALQSAEAFPVTLTTTGFASVVWGGVGVVVYRIERSPELLQLESKIEGAVQPFAVSGGTADAFVRSPGEQINSDTIEWVEHFVPASSGKNYLPHVTLGVAHPDYTRSLDDAPFEGFVSSSPELAIYQLGNFGTARARLWSWRRQ
jgi:2'-5' RNA ligase